MADVLVLLLMTVCGLVPCALSAHWMGRGKVGWTLTLFSVVAAGLAIFWHASNRLMGIDPAKALVAALLVFLPATIGCVAGAFLGWLIERRRIKKFQGKL